MIIKIKILCTQQIPWHQSSTKKSSEKEEKRREEEGGRRERIKGEAASGWDAA